MLEFLCVMFLVAGVNSFKPADHERITEKAYFKAAARALELHTDTEYPDAFALFEAAFGSYGGSLNSSALKDKPTTKFFQANLLETTKKMAILESGADSERYLWSANAGLDKSYELLKELIANMKAYIKTDNYNDLRTACSKTLVILQNFYARTNWLELGNTDAASFLVSTVASLPANLRYTGAQKEEPANVYYRNAHEMAMNSSEAMYNHIKVLMRDTTKFKTFLGINGGKVIAFNIDDTGSMSSDISAAKQHALNIVNSYRASPNPPQKYIIETFNDPEVGVPVITDNITLITSTFNAINAHDGGDAPEMCFTGLEKIFEHLADKSFAEIFVYTDADAKDAAKLPTILGEIDRTSARVTFLMTGSLSAKTLAAYTQVTAQSNGDYLQVDKGNILNTVNFLLERADSLSEPVISMNALTTSKQVEFAVDSSVDSFKFTLNQLSSTSSVKVKQPNGVYVSPTVLSNVNQLSMYEVKSPMAGKWTLDISTGTSTGVTSTPYSVKVNMQTSVSIRVRIVEEMWGDNLSYGGVFEYSDRIPIGEDIAIVVDVLGTSSADTLNLEKLDLVMTTGEIISTHQLVQDSVRKTRYYAPSLTCPSTVFQVKVRSAASGTQIYERLNAQTYFVDSLLVNAYLNTVKGSTYNLYVELKNYSNKKVTLNIKVKKCKDFSVFSSFYENFSITLSAYDSYSEIVVLNSLNSLENKCSVEVSVADKSSAKEIYSKLVNMNVPQNA